jgi:hypothetical protein
MLTCFVHLILKEKGGEAFTLEIGYSTDGKYHEGPLALDPDAPPVNGATSFRLSRLWQKTGSEKWWTLAQQFTFEESVSLPAEEYVKRLVSDDFVKVGLGNVESIVNEALDLIQAHAIPYLQRAAGSFQRQ